MQPFASQIPFRVENGIRYLAPYWTVYRSPARRRWWGREIADALGTEFLSQYNLYAIAALRLGRVFVNGKTMTSLNYKIRHTDSIVHIGHYHEHPILDVPVDIIDETEDLLVVNKPASMPAHPCGRYDIHTVTGQLYLTRGLSNLKTLYRLDRTTSGVMIYGKTYAAARHFYDALHAGEVKKEYVCRVEGVFPSTSQVCDQPIGRLAGTLGVMCIRDDEKGKPATSHFRRLWTDGKTSLVHCHIETGRTHQIRLHMQYLGHPIVGDVLYNSDVWGPSRGKDAAYGRPLDDLKTAVREWHDTGLWQKSLLAEYVERLQRIADAEVVEPEDFDLDNPRLEERPSYDPYCPGCNIVRRTPTMDHMRMMLHCWRYETPKWAYEAELPAWAMPSPDAILDGEFDVFTERLARSVTANDAEMRRESA